MLPRLQLYIQEGLLEDTKGVIRIRLSKKYNTMAKRKRTKGQTTIYKTVHRKLKMEQHEPTKNRGLTPVLPKGKQFLLQL
jgi:hypothetical protein